MLVVVANRCDATAEALVHCWRANDAHLLSCEDLSRPGWRHCLGDPGVSTAVIGSRLVGIEKITGVLSLLPCVTADRLSHILPEDRAYVAAEMMAFLVSWLSELACPVLNRPTPACLMGPNWGSAQWVHAAALAGISVRPIRRRVVLAADPLPELSEIEPATVTVVGDRCFGDVDRTLAMKARRLAAVAGVDMVAIHFDSPEADARLLGADLRPNISSPEIADAILETLERSRRC